MQCRTPIVELAQYIAPPVGPHKLEDGLDGGDAVGAGVEQDAVDRVPIEDYYWEALADVIFPRCNGCFPIPMLWGQQAATEYRVICVWL